MATRKGYKKAKGLSISVKIFIAIAIILGLGLLLGGSERTALFLAPGDTPTPTSADFGISRPTPTCMGPPPYCDGRMTLSNPSTSTVSMNVKVDVRDSATNSALYTSQVPVSVTPGTNNYQIPYGSYKFSTSKSYKVSVTISPSGNFRDPNQSNNVLNFQYSPITTTATIQ
ncbi:MAG TPA: hypothetical protein VJ110_02695 [Candidatus Nanoarchaeia archaeon]|nr:hypothetical protein [Candidatus Nanoarchaeia archaeon]